MPRGPEYYLFAKFTDVQVQSGDYYSVMTGIRFVHKDFLKSKDAWLKKEGYVLVDGPIPFRKCWEIKKPWKRSFGIFGRSV